MYLDTDVILALIKKEDWLKKYVDIDKIKPAKTSTLTITEARIVLLREYSRERALEVLPKIKKLGIKIISIDEKILDKSQELIEKYPNLNMFDAIHAACAIINKEILISTDTVFHLIEEVHNKDPRNLED